MKSVSSNNIRKNLFIGKLEAGQLNCKYSFKKGCEEESFNRTILKSTQSEYEIWID